MMSLLGLSQPCGMVCVQEKTGQEDLYPRNSRGLQESQSPQKVINSRVQFFRRNSNHLRFPHWSSHKFCWLCDCHKTEMVKNLYDFTANPQWKLKSLRGLKESPSTDRPLFKIPGGLPEYRVCLDALRTVDLGVGSICRIADHRKVEQHCGFHVYK